MKGIIKVKSKIKWFNNEKGYGFIENGDGEDIFVHYSEINMDGFRTLKEGEYVKFDLVHTPKGLQAHNVTEINAVNVWSLTKILPMYGSFFMQEKSYLNW